ncbi:MAG: O-antigen ligase family protein [Acidobacteria bacterium]|nr:O-antigen ligase family protein [Acidobacteriota bacterium]
MSILDRITLRSSAGSGIVALIVPILLSVALLTILFPLPQPTIPVNLPFKAETMLTAALLVILLFTLRSIRGDGFAQLRSDLIVRYISFPIVGFIAWSGISFIWGGVVDGAAHHTLLWSVYLVYFLVFTALLGNDPKNRFIISTITILSIFLGVLCLFDYLTLADFKLNEGYIRIRYGKYAEMLAAISPIMWALSVYANKRSLKFLFACGAILSWMTIMLSLSKGAFLGGLLGFIFFFVGSWVFSPRVFRRRIAISAVIWVVFTVGFQGFFSVTSDVPATTDYITGANDPTRTTTAFRVFSWGLGGQMFADNWIVGVGADNFGIKLNASRIRYRLSNPDDPKDEPGEDYIFERAHNEPIQIAAELGVIGLILVLVPFVIFGAYFVRTLVKKRYRSSPMLWASAAGMCAFAFSSMVSSFSFRSAQNGVVFFMVFAIAVNELSKNERRLSGSARGFRIKGPIYAAFWAITLLMGGYCSSKIIAEYNVDQAEKTGDTVVSHYHYDIARALAPEYAGLHLSNAARNTADNEPDKAAINTRRAIDNGIGMALTYSSLAKQQILAGLMDEAEATFEESLRVYPRSIYLRTEYAVFLEKQGRSVDAERQFQISRDVDLRNANGWYHLVKKGSVEAYYLAQTDENIAPPAELVPQDAVRNYVEPTPAASEAQ